MNFGEAIKSLEAGNRVAREGWNGKGMWLINVPESVNISVSQGSPYSKAGLSTVTINSHVDMFTAGGTMQPGWLASQADMKANDWMIVEEKA